MKKTIFIIITLIGIVTIWNSMDTEKVITPKVEKKIEPKKVVQKTFYEAVKVPIIQDIENVSVNIGKDINVTKENDVTLKAKISKSNDNYRYVWKENNKTIGKGKILISSYTKGKHFVKVEVYADHRLIAEDEVLVTAWNYRKVVKSSYTTAGILSRKDTEIYNHLNELIVVEEGRGKYFYTYDDFGRVFEVEYKDEVSGDDYTRSYIYNEENKRIAIEQLDIDGTFRSTLNGDSLMTIATTDENGNQIYDSIEDIALSSKKGSVSYRGGQRTYDKHGNLIRESFQRNDLYMKYDEDGNMVEISSWYRVSINALEKLKYEDSHLVSKKTFSDYEWKFSKQDYELKFFKRVQERTYNEKGTEVTFKSFNWDENGEKNLTGNSVTEYNDEGDKVKEDYKTTDSRFPYSGHFITTIGYENHKIIEKEEVAVEGSFDSDDTIKKLTTYTYDTQGNLLNKEFQSQHKDDINLSKSVTIRELIMSYINELD